VIRILRPKGKRRRTKLSFNANDPRNSDWLPTSDELDDEIEEEAVADGLANDCDGQGEGYKMEGSGPETKPKDKQRVCIWTERFYLPPMYRIPFMKIMRIFGGQGTCWPSLNSKLTCH
jgi:hypothetical protein